MKCNALKAFLNLLQKKFHFANLQSLDKRHIEWILSNEWLNKEWEQIQNWLYVAIFNEVIFTASALYMFRHANVIGQSACRWDHLRDDEKSCIIHSLNTQQINENETNIKENDLHLVVRLVVPITNRTEGATKYKNMCTWLSIILCTLFSFVTEHYSVTVVKCSHRNDCNIYDAAFVSTDQKAFIMQVNF